MSFDKQVIMFVSQKDANYQFEKVSESFLLLTKFKHVEEFTGKTDDECPWYPYVKYYRQQEKDALNGKTYTALIPVVDANNQEHLFAHTKKAIYHENNMVSILCICHPVNKLKYLDLFALDFKALNKQIYKVNYNAKDDFELTKRQHLCLYFLVRGKSAKEIARVLNLSPRTVESYITQLKIKFHCSSKNELVEKAIHLGYYTIVPGKFFLG